MSDTVIKVENVGKLYKLGEIGTGTISHDLNRWWARMRGKEDPFAKIGEMNDRTAKGNNEWVWALKDISFDVKQGEVMGIIGHNGAGKSTLLKILSKVTTPSTGQIKVKGRIASLLEVGTGFHPELTGRENIFLNGAILGMTKTEIKRKLDEIISFAGVERYIDTPVKRYSSGMYVRLAFAVAAHLEPEILIIDEVLAVGDAEFQKKCLGKMDEVSKGGRTVLFVSHNMIAVQNLCQNSILLKKGGVQKIGNTKAVIDEYMATELSITAKRIWESGKEPSDNQVMLLSVYSHDKDYIVKSTFEVTEKIGITMEYEVLIEGIIFTHGLNVYNEGGLNIFNSHDVASPMRNAKRKKGKYKATVWIDENMFSEEIFSVGVALFSPNPFYLHIYEKNILAFKTTDSMIVLSSRGDYTGDDFGGVIRPLLKWDVLHN